MTESPAGRASQTLRLQVSAMKRASLCVICVYDMATAIDGELFGDIRT